MIMEPWGGNIATPASGIVTDGHIMVALAHARREALGYLLEWAQPEYDDFDCEIPARRTAVKNCWKLWGELTGCAQVGATIGGAFAAHDQNRVRIEREDGEIAWVPAAKLACILAAVEYDSVTQAGGVLRALVFWKAGAPVALLMPLRMFENIDEGDPLVVDRERPVEGQDSQQEIGA